MSPKRSVLKLYLCGVSPLKCPTSSLGHSSSPSPYSCHYLQSSCPPSTELVLLVGEDRSWASRKCEEVRLSVSSICLWLSETPSPEAREGHSVLSQEGKASRGRDTKQKSVTSYVTQSQLHGIALSNAFPLLRQLLFVMFSML